MGHFVAFLFVRLIPEKPRRDSFLFRRELPQLPVSHRWFLSAPSAGEWLFGRLLMVSVFILAVSSGPFAVPAAEPRPRRRAKNGKRRTLILPEMAGVPISVVRHGPAQARSPG
jgi:hypothetical protein